MLLGKSGLQLCGLIELISLIENFIKKIRLKSSVAISRICFEQFCLGIKFRGPILHFEHLPGT